MGNDRASLESPALRFACAGADEFPDGIAPERLFDSLGEAESACADGERVLVIEGDGTIPNLDPYRPAEPVTAAGGYVVREGEAGPEVLLIFRRGAWDLPKGKLDPGETVEACALREVCEEVGIGELRLLAPAGTTVHGYPEDGRYLVKTTHWFFMRTPERDFTPEEREGIEQVAWVPWAEAQRRLGYESLRRHMATLRLPPK